MIEIRTLRRDRTRMRKKRMELHEKIDVLVAELEKKNVREKAEIEARI